MKVGGRRCNEEKGWMEAGRENGARALGRLKRGKSGLTACKRLHYRERQLTSIWEPEKAMEGRSLDGAAKC